jgi:hypothetical protein
MTDEPDNPSTAHTSHGPRRTEPTSVASLVSL